MIWTPFVVDFVRFAIGKIRELNDQRQILDAARSQVSAAAAAHLTDALDAIDQQITHLRTHVDLYQERARGPTAPRRARVPLPDPPPVGPCQCATCRGEPAAELEPVQLPVPVTPARTGGELHVLADEIERRSRATEQWAPWARRARRTRRYEGFHWSSGRG